VIVKMENFVRAETAAQFDRVMAIAGGVNRFFHLRGPTPLDKQTVIRMNRASYKTTYEALLVLSRGVADAGAYQLTFRDVPVDAFWSVTVYDKDGLIDPHDQDAYSVNSLTGTPNEDGSHTIHFGGEPGGVNHLPIAEVWNYTVRFYQPREEILDGTWTFPDVKPVAAS
jgi:hypothetical protein